MEKIYVVSKAFCECWTVVEQDPDKVSEAIEHATGYYQSDVETYKSHIINYPDMKDYWQEQLEKAEKILAEGFEGITFDEYMKRQREKWLSKEAKEITEEQWDYALEVLPPLNYHRSDHASFFFMREFLSGPFTEEYYYDFKSRKYFCAVVEYTDESTWIDKLLNKMTNQ